MKFGVFVAASFLLLILCLVPSCSSESTRSFPPPEGYTSWDDYYNQGILTSTTQYSTTPYYGPEVEYKITGTAKKVFVTLSNATGGTEQYDSVYLPKTYTYYHFDNWFMYISAQNLGETGSVEVAIYHRGKLIDSASSYGAYVIASASGSK